MQSKYSRPVALLVILLLVALMAAACGDDDEEPEATPEVTEAPSATLGLSIPEESAFFVTLRDSAQQAAELEGVTLLTASAENDPAAQTEHVQGWIDQGVDALLITPVNVDEIVGVIEAANEADIPVFTIDRSASGGAIISHIASDNVAGGRMAGEYLAEAIGKEGKVVELEGLEGTSAALARGEGFNAAIAEYEGIEVIARETASFQREEASTVFAQILADNPEIDGVFAHNDEMILGALDAAKEAGREADIVFVGFDAVEEAVNAVESGDLRATIAQQPGEMGRISIETALAALDGTEVEESIPVDLALITN